MKAHTLHNTKYIHVMYEILHQKYILVPFFVIDISVVVNIRVGNTNGDQQVQC
jgi:hypothetical protein